MRGRNIVESTRIKQTAWALVAAVCAIACALFLASCSDAEDSSSTSSQSSSQASSNLSGKTIKVYCGAGMTNPFQEIADEFTAETGCQVDVTFANAAQIQTQIKTTQEGDFFIAGSTEELSPVNDYVAGKTDLVKHIPVLVVPSDNPKNVTGISSLASCDTVLIGDPDATPIGKIAKKALTDAGLWDQMNSANVFTTTTTAPQISNALAQGNGDAGIVWKENANSGVKIVETTDLDNYVKTIPAAHLNCSKSDADAVSAFEEFLKTDTANNIWTSYGYELA